MSLSLVEFLAPVKTRSRQAQVTTVLYWHERYANRGSMSAADVRAALVSARVANAKNMNVADVMLKAGSSVDVDGKSDSGLKLWKLTATGHKEVRNLHGLPDEEPEVAHGVAALTRVAAKVVDADTRAYLDEAILCLSVGALRAAIVFVWVGATAELKTRIWSTGAKGVTASVQSRNPNAKALTKKDDLLKLQEVEILQVAQDVGVIDKSERTILGQALDTRNQCGHPNKYDPGVAKARAHIEDLIGILWV